MDNGIKLLWGKNESGDEDGCHFFDHRKEITKTTTDKSPSGSISTFNCPTIHDNRSKYVPESQVTGLSPFKRRKIDYSTNSKINEPFNSSKSESSSSVIIEKIIEPRVYKNNETTNRRDEQRRSGKIQSNFSSSLNSSKSGKNGKSLKFENEIWDQFDLDTPLIELDDERSDKENGEAVNTADIGMTVDEKLNSRYERQSDVSESFGSESSGFYPHSSSSNSHYRISREANFNTSTSFQPKRASTITTIKNSSKKNNNRSYFAPDFQNAKSILRPISVSSCGDKFSSFDEEELLNFPSAFNKNAISVRTEVRYTEEEKKNLIPTTVIPAKYRPVFKKFDYFNTMQSRVFDRVFEHDETLVVSAPTGSGKTVIFELAIVKELIKQDKRNASSPSSSTTSSIAADNSFKVVYIAPLKCLCSQRLEDWQNKFSPFNLMCAELTGDTNDEIIDLRQISIIMTTPEKWDILTRSRDFQNSMESIRLILIDEVHLLYDEGRGPKLEAVVSRFKMACKTREHSNAFRFIAVSATAPNSSDIAEWLSEHEKVQYDVSSRSIVLSDDYRSVQLMKKVIGYHCAASWNDFVFEANLNSKLRAVIEQYSEQKPTLVFVATRKSCYQTAQKLAGEGTFVGKNYHLSVLRALQNTLKDAKLKENILKGIAFHHAGLSLPDRQAVEKYFSDGFIPVLISTSTLALGVNLPAHLVVIKGTSHYVNGECIEYLESEISQMMGRAGRPDYGGKGRSVIMTKKQLETKYKKLVSGTQIIESFLPKYLCECLNAEIVLRTICSIKEATEWMNSTFFAIRVRKNPQNYNMDPFWTEERIQEKVQDMIKIELNRLKRLDMIQVPKVEMILEQLL